jgi:Na+/H+-dicarboxylate symporter
MAKRAVLRKLWNPGFALIFGLLVGLFFGEKARFLDIPARGFVRLLQMTVLPSVTVSLVAGIGSLDYKTANALFKKVGMVLLVIWGLALVVVFMMPLAFPPLKTASFFSPSLVAPPKSIDFLELYIPDNPFYSLANNIVPAVVLFSVVVGVALIGVEKKQGLIDLLEILRRTLNRATGFVQLLIPLGIFAIAASTAGTIGGEDLLRLQVFLVTYGIAALFMTFWLLPGLVSLLTPVPAREVIGEMKQALITAFMIGDLLVVLPLLMERSKALLAKHRMAGEESQELSDVIVPASFNFPHAAKILTLGFILFAGWYSGASVQPHDYPLVAGAGLISIVGSVNSAVPFLLDLLRVPADTFQLFVATGPVNSRFGTMAAAMHTVVVALVGTAAMVGSLSVKRRRILPFVALSAALLLGALVVARAVFSQTLSDRYDKDKILAGMQLIQDSVATTIYRTPPATILPPVPVGQSRLDAIRKRGVLRVGYFSDAMPYAFFNGQGDLVGLDVKMAHILAQDLGVKLELVPVERQRLTEQLTGDDCDVVMSGLLATPGRAGSVLLTAPYLEETEAFFVKDHLRDKYRTWETIAKLDKPRIAVPFLLNVETLRRHLPRAELLPFRTADEMFELLRTKADASWVPAERGSVWTLLHPEFSVVIPEANPPTYPLVYAVAGRDQDLARFLDTWIELKQRDGTIRTQYDKWVLGKEAVTQKPRWSVVRDVLHWVD